MGLDFSNSTSSSTSSGGSSISQQAIINANMERAQIGSSFTNPIAGAFTLDMWSNFFTVTGTAPTSIIHTQNTLTSGELFNSKYSYNVNVNGAGSGFAAADVYGQAQKIEFGTSKLCGAGKFITITIMAKSSIAGKKLAVGILQGYGTGGSPSATEILVPTSTSIRTLSTTFALYTFTFTTNTLVGKTFGTNNDDCVSLLICEMWGSTISSQWFGGSAVEETFGGSGNISFTQVTLNSGDTAVPFQPKANELNEIQRYTGVYTDANISFPIGNGFALSTTQARIQVKLPQTMRIAPALTATATDWQLSDGVTATDLTAISIVSGQSSNKSVTLLCTVASGLTQFRPYQLIADGTANRLMVFNAEM